MKLTPAQQRAKDEIRRTRTAQKTARSAFEQEMEIAWRERSGRVTQDVLEAVRTAVHLGVPTRQIGQAYGTTDHNTIKRVIDQVKQEQTRHVLQTIKVHVLSPDRFTIELMDYSDWADEYNHGNLSGSVTYARHDSIDDTGEWLPEEFGSVATAVDRELWRTSPLRTEVAKHVALDSVPVVEQDEDYDDEDYDDDDSMGMGFSVTDD